MEQRVFWVGDKFCVRLRFKTHFSQCPASRKLKLYENMEKAFKISSGEKIEVDCDCEHHDHCGSGILHCPRQRKWLETKDEVCLLWRHPPNKTAPTSNDHYLLMMKMVLIAIMPIAIITMSSQIILHNANYIRIN